MKIIHSLTFQTGSKEEKLPYDSSDFPYVASRAELGSYQPPFVPWHWHNAIELFYIESGELKYCTPHQTRVFPAGSAGMVNANVLHKTQFQPYAKENVQLLHMFDAQLLAGNRGSRIDKKYISPVLSSSQLELIALYPDDPAQAEGIDLIRRAFLLSEEELGYEFRIREALSQIWIHLFQMYAPLLQDQTQAADLSADKVKNMMTYVHEHYAEKITIGNLAASAFLSERTCYRIFQKHLHMTPADYIQSFRLQIACQLLAESQMPVTEVGMACGIANTSHFGKVFRDFTGCTPRQYRRKWQNNGKR